MKKLLSIMMILCVALFALTGCDWLDDIPDWSVNVHDEDGNAVEGVSLQVCDDSTCTVLSTNAEGKFDFSGEKDSYDVHVLYLPDGYAVDVEDYKLNKYEELEITLSKSDSAVSSDSENEDYDNSISEENNENEETESSEDQEEPEVDLSSFQIRTGEKVTFQTVDKDGNPYDSSIFSQYKLTMINLWEPWCGPCRSEMPDIERLYQENKDNGLLVLGVHGDNDGLSSVLSETGVTYPILDSTNSFYQFINRSGCYPTTIFVDSEGYVLAPTDSEPNYGDYSDGMYMGSNDYSTWKTRIDTRLGL